MPCASMFPSAAQPRHRLTRAILTCERRATFRMCSPTRITRAHRTPRSPAAFRSVLAVPLMREGRPIGAIAVGRPEPGQFPDEQIALLQTFADQAVIAIENVRLFKELEARNADLTEALEQQTATSEILRVISQSQTDVQPVFDAIARARAEAVRREFGHVCHVRRRAHPFVRGRALATPEAAKQPCVSCYPQAARPRHRRPRVPS